MSFCTGAFYIQKEINMTAIAITAIICASLCGTIIALAIIGSKNMKK
jgi:hypothetical protein